MNEATGSQNGSGITFESDGLNVPDNPIIPFIKGDGIGPEIWEATRHVVDNAVKLSYHGARSIQWMEVVAGERAFNEQNDWLPPETISAIREFRIAVKGPLTTPVGGGIRSLNVALRQELDLYACVRPVRYFKGVPSPVRQPELVDMVIFRENSEDLYAGIEFMNGTAEVRKLIDFLQGELKVNKLRFPSSSSIGIKPVSKEGTERLVKSSIEYAIRNRRSSITIVHKGNIMKYTEGAFRNWAYDLAEREFSGKCFTMMQYHELVKEVSKEAADKAMKVATDQGKVIIKDRIADNFLQQIILNPGEFDVIATLNLNGDYISDAVAALVGGIGIAPGANINFSTGHAIFEATHGTAPDIAGKNSANPSSMLLSCVMMLEYMGWNESANMITLALEKTIDEGRVTGDFFPFMKSATLMSCSGFGDEIAAKLIR